MMLPLDKLEFQVSVVLYTARFLVKKTLKDIEATMERAAVAQEAGDSHTVARLTSEAKTLHDRVHILLDAQEEANRRKARIQETREEIAREFGLF